MAATAIILGAGLPDGVGGATAIRFAAEGLHVIVSGRTLEKLEQTVAHIVAAGGSAEACIADVTSPSDTAALLAHATGLGVPLACVVYNAGNNRMVPFAELTAEDFENYWRVCCFGGFLAAKQAMPILAEQGSGSMIFTGASASLRGKPAFGHFASAKGALRNLAQALAREYGPSGVHVAHVIIDGVINGNRARTHFADFLSTLGPDGALDPAAIADVFWMVHAQPRSAWTHELDLRPFSEGW
jgi:NAD(P)-dependent dehydrogenase (short-subunit alcohol dehydrogenase family)